LLPQFCKNWAEITKTIYQQMLVVDASAVLLVALIRDGLVGAAGPVAVVVLGADGLVEVVVLEAADLLALGRMVS
jgi:hypothetical protein